MSRQRKIVIMSQTAEENNELRNMLESEECSVEERPGPGTLLEQEDPEVDLYVVSLSEGYDPGNGKARTIARVPRKRILYVASNIGDNLRHELFRAGASGVRARPFNKIDLQFQAQLIMNGDWNRLRKDFDEAAMLDFVKKLSESRLELIEPVLDAQMPGGHYYPAVAKILGRSSTDRECLDKLASLGLLAREVANRVRLCPECDDSHVNHRETCPKCNALNIHQQEMITHFACAHTARLQDFHRGDQLVCPKCTETLRHIGVDYEKPSRLFFCNDCENIFADPAVETQCMNCNCVCTPNETIERTIYRFLVTPLAEQAVIEGHISGVNLEVLLRNTQTGLYSKSYFEHEIRRELIRSERYKSPFSMLLVRIDHFEEVAAMHPSEATQFAESIFRAVSTGLRTLDTTCVWDIDTLGVILSATPKDNSLEVVKRIQKSVERLEFLYSVREPSVTISLVSNEEGYATQGELTAAALKDLQE